MSIALKTSSQSLYIDKYRPLDYDNKIPPKLDIQ